MKLIHKNDADEILCPYCHKNLIVVWEYEDGTGNYNINCPECNKPILIIIEFAIKIVKEGK